MQCLPSRDGARIHRNRGAKRLAFPQSGVCTVNDAIIPCRCHCSGHQFIGSVSHVQRREFGTSPSAMLAFRSRWRCNSVRRSLPNAARSIEVLEGPRFQCRLTRSGTVPADDSLIDRCRFPHQVVIDGAYAWNRFGSYPDGLPLLVGFRKAPEVNDAVAHGHI
jgi:hypothetical protein